ncbi:MAG: hypothetical protein ABIQ31_23070 [Ferruginibacter sp.]
MLTRRILFLALLPLSLSSVAQLATVRTVEPQKSSFKTIGTGLNLDTYYDDDHIRYYQFHDVVECADGFYKVGINNNSGYQKKKNLFIHVIKMDKDLQISREFDIEMKIAQNNSHVTPFALYRNGNKIELLANNKTEEELNIINLEFNLSDFSVARGEQILGSFTIPEKSYCDFLYNVNEKSGYVGISFVERKGKKAKECAIHSLSWNNDMKRVSQQSSELNMAYDPDILSKIKTSASGETWTLLDSRDKKFSTGTSVYYMGNNKGKLTEILKENKQLTGASLALDKNGSGILVAGFIADNAAEVNERLLIIHLDDKGALVPKTDYVIPESFLAKTTKLEKKTRDLKGLSKYYFIREVTVRENEIIDIVASFIYLDVGLSPSGPFTKTTIGDVLIYSFQGDKIVSSICINRNIRDNQRGEYAMAEMKDFSIPFLYTQGDDLVMLCIVNSSSFSAGNNSGLDDQYISNAQFTAIKIDKQFKVTKQVVYDLTEKIKGFDTFTEIILRKINKGQFFGYHETEFGLTTKAKLTFSHIKVK